MGFIVNKKSKMIHKDTCGIVKDEFKKTKKLKTCKYEYFDTLKKCEQYFINSDKEYSFCKKCNPLNK